MIFTAKTGMINNDRVIKKLKKVSDLIRKKPIQKLEIQQTSLMQIAKNANSKSVIDGSQIWEKREIKAKISILLLQSPTGISYIKLFNGLSKSYPNITHNYLKTILDEMVRSDEIVKLFVPVAIKDDSWDVKGYIRVFLKSKIFQSENIKPIIKFAELFGYEVSANGMNITLK